MTGTDQAAALTSVRRSMEGCSSTDFPRMLMNLQCVLNARGAAIGREKLASKVTPHRTVYAS
jgi:hypothetical protein